MKAKSLLGLREHATLQEIKQQYKTLMKQWHPDKHTNNPQQATQMSIQINEAYDTIMEYCTNYQFPFDEESIKKTTLSPEEWWQEKFASNHNKERI